MFSSKKKNPSETKNLRQSILDDGGVLAPAQIHTVARRKWSDTKTFDLDFDVEVQPEGGTPFRAAFRAVVGHQHFSMYGGELIGHSGARIWVAYDPSDLTRVAFDSFDASETSPRHRDFEKLTDGNEDLKKRGEAAEALITGVDDLDLPYPSKNARAKHLHFEVTPQSGVVFQSEGDFLLGDTAAAKYSVGKKVFVRFDPRDPKRVALDSERNKSIT